MTKILPSASVDQIPLGTMHGTVAVIKNAKSISIAKNAIKNIANHLNSNLLIMHFSFTFKYLSCVPRFGNRFGGFERAAPFKA